MSCRLSLNYFEMRSNSLEDVDTHYHTVSCQKTADRQVCPFADITRSLILCADLVVVMEVIHPPTHDVSANSHLCLPTHIHTLMHTQTYTQSQSKYEQFPDIIIIPCCALMC